MPTTVFPGYVVGSRMAKALYADGDAQPTVAAWAILICCIAALLAIAWSSQ